MKNKKLKITLFALSFLILIFVPIYLQQIEDPRLSDKYSVFKKVGTFLTFLKYSSPKEETVINTNTNTNVKATIKEYLNTNKWKTYETNSFSFKYSENFKMTSALNEGNEIITAEDDKFGFQIFITPFDEAGPITKERILRDVPDMQINDSGQAKLDDIETLIFNGYNEDIGETFEAWVVHKNKLYQIMTGQEQEKLLEKVLDTWKWK